MLEFARNSTLYTHTRTHTHTQTHTHTHITHKYSLTFASTLTLYQQPQQHYLGILTIYPAFVEFLYRSRHRKNIRSREIQRKRDLEAGFLFIYLLAHVSFSFQTLFLDFCLDAFFRLLTGQFFFLPTQS